MPVFDDLKAKLQELFMFDRADLDFGMYRILNAKRAEINRFLETELLPSARAALGSVTASDQARLKAAVDAAREQARKFGAPNPDATAAVQEAVAAYKTATDTVSLEEEIYSHLLTFFSRYYQDGDFISQRRYSAAGRERYVIPYDGEEVKLVWANREQYYIKSSEALTNYAFTFDHPTGAKRVEFRLIQATEENANNKARSGERRFALADLTAHPLTFEDERTMTIRFTYLEHPKGTKQSDLLNRCEQALSAASISEEFRRSLFAADPSYTGKGARTLLRKHLDIYAAKNTYDYFIHKDLGGFLRRELDFFIKNEALRLDDLLPEDPAAARQQLRKVRALRDLGTQIAAFLEQIENFQKRLWLKKRFVTETRYCLTLDRIAEEFYPEIAANVDQRAEWESLYGIRDIAPDTAGQPGYPGGEKPLTPEFLKANSGLMVDTTHFPMEFNARLIAAIPNLDESLDGVCIEANNFCALNLIQASYDQSIQAVYIDPPYNTGDDGFQYKDGFTHSTWLTALTQTTAMARNLIKPSGALASSIDDIEFKHLWYALSEVFGSDNYLGSLVWKRRSASGMSSTPLSLDHEYILCFARKKSEAALHGIERVQADYPLFDEAKQLWYASTDLTIGATREARPNQFYPITNPRTGRAFPANPNRVWRFFPETMGQVIRDDLIIWPDEFPGDLERPRYKTFFYPDSARSRPVSSWIETTGGDEDVESASAEYALEILETAMNQEGGRVVERMFGSKAFAYPKPVSLLKSIVRTCARERDTVLDFYAGSGTTGHAVIEQNRTDQQRRRYVLIEMGEHFEHVLVRRLKKIAYAAEWKEGKPKRRDAGLSQAFKILKLESYEDTLENLRLPSRTVEQTLAFDHASAEVRADYLMRYSLELETRGSPSLLDLAKFSAPWSYQLRTHRNGEARLVTVDLVETFNWLLGLRVERRGAPTTVTAEFEIDAAGRTSVSEETLRAAAAGWTFQAITGRDRSGRLNLILWRSLTGDIIRDNAVLDAYFQEQGYAARSAELETIYVNGDNTLANLFMGNRVPEAPGALKVKLIEGEFHRLMWEARDV